MIDVKYVHMCPKCGSCDTKEEGRFIQTERPYANGHLDLTKVAKNEIITSVCNKCGHRFEDKNSLN
jgi:hypothetical protein